MSARLTMTDEEIIREYRQAKQPLKQIGILAEENLCDKKEIVAILRAAGCNLPQQYDHARHKVKKQPETAPEAEANPAEEAPAPQVRDHYTQACDAIFRMMETADSHERLIWQIEGVLAMLREVAR